MELQHSIDLLMIYKKNHFIFAKWSANYVFSFNKAVLLVFYA